MTFTQCAALTLALLANALHGLPALLMALLSVTTLAMSWTGASNRHRAPEPEADS